MVQNEDTPLDSDGIPDYNDYDPTGYFYDRADGNLVATGAVAALALKRCTA